MSNPSLKGKSDLHVARYVFHAASGVLLALMTWYLSWGVMVSALAILSLCMIGQDIYRLQVPEENQRVIKLTASIMRDSERNHYASSSFFIVGCLFTVIAFPREIAVQAILFLALGDPAAAWFGNRFGASKLIAEKTIAGALMCMCVCALIALFFNYNLTLPLTSFVALIFVSGLIGMFSELTPVGNLNDNLTMPLLSATGLLLLGKLLGVQ